MSETTSQCDSIWDDEVNDGIDGTKPKESKPPPVITLHKILPLRISVKVLKFLGPPLHYLYVS